MLMQEPLDVGNQDAISHDFIDKRDISRMSTLNAGYVPALRDASRSGKVFCMPTLNLDALKRALLQETKPSGNWSREALSKAAGGKRDLVRDILRGTNKKPSADHVVLLAKAMNRDLAEFIDPSSSFQPLGRGKKWLPIEGVVQAGVWREETGYTPEFEVEVATPDERGREQFVVELQGLSMNKTIPPGSVLECTRVIFGSIEPQPGDLVIVQRHAHNLTELTCKRLAKGAGGWELHCESTEPEFQDPILIGEADLSLHIDNEIRIIGIVDAARQFHGRHGRRRIAG